MVIHMEVILGAREVVQPEVFRVLLKVGEA